MRCVTFALLSIPLLAQCVPLVERTGSVQTSLSISSTMIQSTATSQTAFASTAVSSPSQTSSPTSSVVPASETPQPEPQPEIITSPDGSESVFIAPGNNSQISSNPSTRPLVMGYYPSWSSDILAPEKINFTRYDWVVYAFATLNETYQLSFDDSSFSDLLRRVVSAAHASGGRVQLSIGGWDGSRYFSSAVSTASNRQAFVQQVLEFYQDYTLDGVDFDWEYPGREGDDGNQVSSEDSQNFLAFLQLLRAALPSNASISAAASQTPFAGPDSQPMQDVSAFAEPLSWVTIMNYDVCQSSPTPGPNAPLYDGCHDSTQPQANAASAFKQWTTAGFPASKLVLGVPYYGYVSASNASTLRSRASSPSTRVEGDDNGSIPFRDLVSQGALTYTNGEYTGSNGFVRYWDPCSATPYLRSEASRQVISYDDPQSLGMKAQFVKQTGMLGTNAWDLTSDTDEQVLGSALDRGYSSS